MKHDDDELTRARSIVEKNIILLNWRAPFFGAIISSLNREYTYSLRPATMAVTADTLYIHPGFVVENPGIVLFALCHEALHVAFEHVCRLPQGDKLIRNIAADFVVNGIIASRETLEGLQISLPEGILYNPQFKDLCLEEVYDLLQKTRNQTSQGQGQGPEQGQGQKQDQERGQGQDQKQVQKKGQGQGQKKGRGQKKGQGQGQGQGQGRRQDLENRVFDAHNWASNPDSKTQMRVREIVLRAAIAAKAAGKLPGALQRALESMEEGRVEWKEVLANFLAAVGAGRENYSTRPSVLTSSVSQCVGDWTWVPALDGVRAGRVSVVVDTSGSISDSQLAAFLGEVISLQHTVSELYVLYADACVQQAVLYTEWDTPQVEDLIRKCVGGGGTDFRPAIHESITKECQAVIYLTDGYGTFPEQQPEIPVLWVLTSRGANLPPWAQVLYLPPQS